MWAEHTAGREINLIEGQGGFAPGRPSLLLVHGAGGRAAAFQAQLSLLGEHLNIAALDLPGHGQTPGPGRQRVEDYADWLAEVLAAGPVRPVLLGHSMGGTVAMNLALSHPRLLRGLILLSTGPRLPVAPAILQGLEQDFEATVERIVRLAYSMQADPSLIRQGIANMTATGPEVVLGDFQACDQVDLRPRLAEINLPTLVLTGELDRMIPPKFSEQLAQSIPGAQLRIIPGVGHAPHLEDHLRTNQALGDFMASR